MKETNLTKAIWTENDFDEMQWHDCKIYAMAFEPDNFELIFDIDYIIEWVTMSEDQSSFKFLISPVTLVFKNVYDINISLYSIDFQIQNLSKSNPSTPKNAGYVNQLFEYDWTFATTNGNIVFKSVGYHQYARKAPMLLERQAIDIEHRGGISFDRTPYSK